MAKKLKLSGSAVLLIIVVPVVLSSSASSYGVSFSIRGALAYLAKPGGAISVGPWGGSGGQPFYMRGSRAPRLRTIVLYHSTAIHSLSLVCDYSLAGHGDDKANNRNRTAGPWGRPYSFGSKGVRATIKLSAGEHVTAVEGTTGHFGSVPDVVITSLTFRSGTGRTYGPYGSKAGGTPFSVSVPPAEGACIVGFWGRSGWLVDATGVYVRPCSSSSAPARYNHRRPYAAAVPSPPKMYAVPPK